MSLNITYSRLQPHLPRATGIYFCCVVYQFREESHSVFTHIHQGFVSGTGAILSSLTNLNKNERMPHTKKKGRARVWECACGNIFICCYPTTCHQIVVFNTPSEILWCLQIFAYLVRFYISLIRLIFTQNHVLDISIARGISVRKIFCILAIIWYIYHTYNSCRALSFFIHLGIC